MSFEKMGEKTINWKNEKICRGFTMSFGGGGSGVLQNHDHSATPLMGGPLDFVNTTIASLNNGSITYSNGVALQELVAGNEGDRLQISGGVPVWHSGIYQWDQLSTGQTIGMQLGAQETVQEFQTGFEIIGHKIIKVEWSARRNVGTGNNLSFRCEVVDSSCVVQDTIGSDYDASTVGASFEFIEFDGSTTNYAIQNTDMLRLKIVDDGGGSGADQFSSELCSSCTIANTRGGYDNGSCVQSWYASRNATIKVTYQEI